MELHQTPLVRALAEAATSPRERAELALAIGVDVTTIWRWAKGRSHPNSDATREAIARALGRHPSELFPTTNGNGGLEKAA